MRDVKTITSILRTAQRSEVSCGELADLLDMLDSEDNQNERRIARNAGAKLAEAIEQLTEDGLVA